MGLNLEDTKRDEEIEEEIEEDEQVVGSGMAESDIVGGPPVSQLSEGLGSMLLGLIGLTAQTLAVLHEADEQAFHQNSKKLHVFYSLAGNFPGSPLNKKPTKEVKTLGFKVPVKKTVKKSSKRRQ